MLERKLYSDTVVAKPLYVLHYRLAIRLHLDVAVAMSQPTLRCIRTHLPSAANDSGAYGRAGVGCRCISRHSTSTHAVRHADTALSIYVVSSSLFYELCICPHDPERPCEKTRTGLLISAEARRSEPVNGARQCLKDCLISPTAVKSDVSLA